MAVKIVTDSSSDIPSDITDELGITVVPLYIHFGNETFRDGVDINADEFYERLIHSHITPKTSAPSPGDYAQVYNRLAADADGILSIHLSPRYSSTIHAATLAKEYVSSGCEIVVVDSKSVSMGCGLAVIAAARAARNGAGPEQVKQTVEETIKRTHIVGMINDIRYLLHGRRLALPGMHLFLGRLGSLFRLKLVGEIYRAGHVRGRGIYINEEKALEKMQQCVTVYQSVEEMAVLHASRPDWATRLRERMGLEYPATAVFESRLSGATGIHGGPNAAAIAFITATD